MKFGEFFRTKRIELGLTLRKFCQGSGLDPAYVSRIENGLSLPPESIEKLKGLAVAIKLEEGTIEWVTFFDLASAAKGEIPLDIHGAFPNINSILPAFYRTLRKRTITKTDVNSLLTLIKDGKKDE